VTANGSSPHVVVIGAGFCGLTAAHELVKRGLSVTVLEQDQEIGGLAGSFTVSGTRLEKFYHHWFTSDRHIMGLITELGLGDNIILRPTNTGLFYANTIFRLSSPLDVLRFKPLPLIDRLRLGILALYAPRIRDWQKLESLTAAQWLRDITGKKAYEVVWEPLLRGKFGLYADEVSAVWFWNKLKLRGGSRDDGGAERLAYYRGGFAALADRVAADIQARGGTIRTGATVSRLSSSQGRCVGVVVNGKELPAKVVVATTALPILADLVAPHVTEDYVAALRRIKYLANLCLVLELDRSLSETYWLNINDPEFPFVGVIEHTNFESPASYGGKHIVYLSKYLPDTEAYFNMSDDEVLQYTLPHLKRMFPKFEQDWILGFHVWRAHYSQPVVERNYSRLIPSSVTPLQGLYLASMAQVYPEDRGTNYAVREGQRVAVLVSDRLAHC
jgi:protoporphyrinogen oxidase